MCSKAVLIVLVATVAWQFISAVEEDKLYLRYEKPSVDSVLVICAYCGEETSSLALTNNNSDTVSAATFVNNTFDPTGDCYMVNTQLLVQDTMLPLDTEFECILTDSDSGVAVSKKLLYPMESGSSHLCADIFFIVFIIVATSQYILHAV